MTGFQTPRMLHQPLPSTTVINSTPPQIIERWPSCWRLPCRFQQVLVALTLQAFGQESGWPSLGSRRGRRCGFISWPTRTCSLFLTASERLHLGWMGRQQLRHDRRESPLGRLIMPRPRSATIRPGATTSAPAAPAEDLWRSLPADGAVVDSAAPIPASMRRLEGQFGDRHLRALKMGGDVRP